MDMPHDYEIEDNTQLVLRNIIESCRILPYNLSFSELGPSMQSFLLKACKSYKPTCVSGDVNHSCIFRYFNNGKTSKILQPRYKCKTCKRLFTLFGQCYRRKRSSVDGVVADPNEDGQHVSIDEIFEGAAPDSTSPTAEETLSYCPIVDTDQYQLFIESYSKLDSTSLLHEPTMNSYSSNGIVNGVSSTQGDSHENGVQENDKCDQYQIIESYSKDNMSISHSSSVDGIDDFDIDDISEIDGRLDQTYFPNSIDNERVSLLANWNSEDEFKFDQTLNLLQLLGPLKKRRHEPKAPH